MTELVAISPERHAGKAWKRHSSFAFAARDGCIPVMGNELGKVVSAFPMGFMRAEDRYHLVAVTSLQPGTNMYVAPNGQWLGGYVPAVLRSYPFRLAQLDPAQPAILCVDETSGLVVDSGQGEEAFFDPQGQPTPVVMSILNLLSAVERNRGLTQQAVDTLANANLISKWVLNLKSGEQIVPVEGLYRIDETALNALPDADFLSLRKTGAITVAYAQLLSMNQLEVLARLVEAHGHFLMHQHKQSQLQTMEEALANIEGFKLSQDDLELKFS